VKKLFLDLEESRSTYCTTRTKLYTILAADILAKLRGAAAGDPIGVILGRRQPSPGWTQSGFLSFVMGVITFAMN
jgi:hypothetical protein